MLSANWNFLDFSDPTTNDVWYEALKPYHEAEVRQGVRDAILNLKNTPVVADVLEFVEAVHNGTLRRQAEENAHKAFSDAVKCKACNDHGYVTIIYPDGTEAIRPCNCTAGHERWGDEVYKFVDKPLPQQQEEQYFGKVGMNGHKLIRVMPTENMVNTNRKIKVGDEFIPLRKTLYVQYRPTGKTKEHIYCMWVEK